MKLLSMTEVTISTAVLVLAVVLIHIFFRKKLSPNVKYFLWIFVALRILLPFKIEMNMEVPVSVYEQIEDVNINFSEQGENIYEQENQENTNDTYDLNQESERPITKPGVQWTPQKQPDMADTIEKQSINWNQIGAYLVSAVYLTGALCLAFYVSINNLKLLFYLKHHRKMRQKLQDSNLIVYSVKGYNCLAGIIKPSIYADTEQLVNENVIKNVIWHELQHYKAKDNIWQAVRVLCLILQWYNPFVWYAYFASKKDCELACDYRTVKHMTDAERHEYGSSLFAISRSLNKSQKLSIATSVGDNKKFLEARIRTIMESKYRRAVIFTCITVSVIALVSIIGVITINLLPENKSAVVESEAFGDEEPSQITQTRYEYNGSYIEFEDMPQTEAENIACLERLYQITGEKYRFAKCWHENALPHSGYADYTSESNADKSGKYEYIIVKDVHEMTYPELSNLDAQKSGMLFNSLRETYMPDMRLDSYVKMLLQNDCKVVSIEFDSKYKLDAVLGDPHVGDGEGNVVYWLMVPDENGEIKAWDWDTLYGRFDMHSYVKDISKIPEEFKSVRVKSGVSGHVLYENKQEELKLAFMNSSGTMPAEWSHESLNAMTQITYQGGGRLFYNYENEAGKECTYSLYYKKSEAMGYEWLETVVEPYELPEMTQTRYEHNGSYIEFEDMPETVAETLVCLNKLYAITC